MTPGEADLRRRLFALGNRWSLLDEEDVPGESEVWNAAALEIRDILETPGRHLVVVRCSNCGEPWSDEHPSVCAASPGAQP